MKRDPLKTKGTAARAATRRGDAKVSSESFRQPLTAQCLKPPALAIRLRCQLSDEGSFICFEVAP